MVKEEGEDAPRRGSLILRRRAGGERWRMRRGRGVSKEIWIALLIGDTWTSYLGDVQDMLLMS